MAEPASYYKRGDVAGEIAEFLRNRWAAVALRDGRWLRWDGDRPLRVSSPDDVMRLAERGARSFYGSIELFSRLESREDVEDLYPSRVVAATSFIDIDVVDESMVEAAWQKVVEAARAIVDALCGHGLCESVYLLWSGAGMHVRIHEDALRVPGYDPLEAAYLAAEAGIRLARDRLAEIVESSGGLVKIENLVGRKRVFTAPLSLHRRLDRVAVTLKPEALDSFTLSWTIPGQAVHDPEAWRRRVPGEAKRLLEWARARLGSPERSVIARPARLPGGRIHRPPRPQGEPGRFPVMALLQAARYYLLTGDLEKAKSFGLNRAIFYAWAKYHGPARSAARLAGRAGSRPARGVRLVEVKEVGERVPVSEDGWFSMGGVEQRPEDFDRNVARRFEEVGIPFEEAWRAALEYVSRFPRSVLRDPQRFYKRVYEPVRDAFVEKVLRPGMERAREPWEARGSGERKPAGKPERPRPRSLLDWLED